MRSRILFLVAAVLLGTGVALAQQGQLVIYVADFHVKPGLDEQFMNLVKKHEQPVFEKLLGEGTVIAWGVDIPVLHRVGAPTHSFWWSVPDTAALDKVFAALEEMEEKVSDDDAQAGEDARKRGRPAPKSDQQTFLEIVDIGKHQDYLLRHLVVGRSSSPPPAGFQPSNWINLVRVLPGKSEEYRRLWEQYNKPVFDKLVAEGAIYAYALGTEEARSTDAFTHYVVLTLPDLAAREKVRAAFNADRQARTPAERSIITNSFLNVTDPSASRTEILRTVIYQTSPPK
ncbi:MAG: hypothetical protein HY656_03595 [Acidobacteria bacterium]|nr:hypothetical protein [Acidobacteriota bacterium]